MTEQKAPRPRVLLVEDDDQLRALLVAGLAAAGFDVVPVADGAVAQTLVQRALVPPGLGLPDVVLADIHMPGCDGLELMDWLKSRHDVATVVMTALADRQTYVAAKRRGATHCLQKPVSVQAVVRALRAALASRWIRAGERPSFARGSGAFPKSSRANAKLKE